jgi:HlyD family secretion protein
MWARVGFVLLPSLLLLVSCAGKEQTIGGSGIIEADEAVVSAETAGRILDINVHDGASVQPGDTLLTIDPSKLQLALASAQSGRRVVEAQLAATRVDVARTDEGMKFAGNERDRVTRLYAAGTATRKQLDAVTHEATQARLANETARAGLITIGAQIARIDADIASINRQLSDCHPVAPIGGIVTESYVDRGELASAGKALLRISRLDSVWVKVYLNSGDFAKVKAGQSATVSTETGGAIFQGTIIWTSDGAEFTPKNVQTAEARANLVYAVKVSLANSDGSLKIGMPVYVTIQ